MDLKPKDIFLLMTGLCSVVGLALVPGEAPKIALAGLAVVALVLMVVSRLWPRSHVVAAEVASKTVKGNPAANGLTVEPIKNRAQLKELWELDEQCYGAENVPFETLNAWWQSYRQGIYLLLDSDHTIVGAVGIFPIRQHSLELLIDGKLREDEIDASVIDTDNADNCWYISGIVLAVPFRKTRAIRALLSGSLETWAAGLDSGKPIRIGAIAFSSAGENLLRKFRFYRYQRAENTVFNHPTYLYETDDQSDLKQLLASALR